MQSVRGVEAVTDGEQVRLQARAQVRAAAGKPGYRAIARRVRTHRDGPRRRAGARNRVQSRPGIPCGHDHDDAQVDRPLQSLHNHVIFRARRKARSQAQIDDVHAVGDGIVDRLQDAGRRGGGIVADHLVVAEEGPGSNARNRAFRGVVLDSGGDHGRRRTVTIRVSSVAAEGASVEALVAARHDHLAAGVAQIFRMVHSRVAGRGFHAVGAKARMSGVDAGVQNADFDPLARPLSPAHFLPSLSDRLALLNHIRRRPILHHGVDAFHAGVRGDGIQVGFVDFGNESVQCRLRPLDHFGTSAGEQFGGIRDNRTIFRFGFLHREQLNDILASLDQRAAAKEND